MSASETPQSTRLAILIPFFAVTLVWGSTWLVIKDQLELVPPSWSVAYRFCIGGGAMLLWAAMRRDSLLPGLRMLPFVIALGLCQFVINFNFVYRAEQHITSGLVAIIFALLLVPNAVLARIFLGQRLGLQLIVGSSIAVAGVALLFVHELRLSGGGGNAILLGLGMSLLGVLFASSANVMQATQTAKKLPVATLIGWAMLSGAMINAAFALATSGPPVFDYRPSYTAGLLYLGVIGSAFSFSLYFRIIQAIGPAKAAYSSVLIPVIAMLLSTLFEGYRWSLWAAGGALLVIAGLMVALTARRPNR